MKKFLAFLLSCLMVFSTLPMGVFAEAVTPKANTDENILSLSSVIAHPGSEVTLALHLKSVDRVSSFGFIDLTYDSEKLELIDGEWSQELEDDATVIDWDTKYLSAVIALNNAISLDDDVFFLTFKVKEGVSNDTFTIGFSGSVISDAPLITVPGTITVTSEHLYASECDATCESCDFIRTAPSSHSFDHRCDTDCNLCGFVREVEGHAFDNACDTICNECQYLRSVPDHVYDHAFDSDCNVCGEARTFPYILGDMNDDGLLAVADAQYFLYHVLFGEFRYPINQNGDFNTDGEINSNDVFTLLREMMIPTFLPPLESEPETFDLVSDFDGTKLTLSFPEEQKIAAMGIDLRSFLDAGYQIKTASGSKNLYKCSDMPGFYIFFDVNNFTLQNIFLTVTFMPPAEANSTHPNVTAYLFEDNGNLRKDYNSGTSHFYENACDATCNLCGETRTVPDHVYKNACDPDCNVCEAIREVPGHVYDDDGDINCNVCGNNRYDSVGTTGDCNWYLKDNVLTVYGNGVMADYTASLKAPWGTKITKVILKEGVTKIGNHSFYNSSALTEAVIPDSVTEIGEFAFAINSALTEIKANNLITIGKSAFSHCESLKTFSAGNRLETIGERAFSNCTALESITFSNSVKSIGPGAFSTCSSLAEIDLGNCLESIPDKVFQACRVLKTVKMPDTVTSIGQYAFYGCHELQEISFPNALTTIEASAFHSCRNLKEATFQENLKNIGENAFYGCTSLISVSFGASLSTLDSTAFNSCKALESITVESGNTTFHSQNNCLIKTKTKSLVLGCKNSVIPDDGSVLSIASRAFYNCSGLTEMNIPDSVTGIGSYAFYNCPSLTKLSLGKAVKSISSYAFQQCSALESVTIPDKVTTIGESAFSKCESLTTVSLGNSLKTIGGSAFSACKSLTSITLPASLTSVKSNALQNCSALADVWYLGTETAKETIDFTTGNDPLKNASWHYIDNVCDSDCNVCGKTYEEGGHVYDEQRDSVCNRCGETRTLPYDAYGETGDCNWILNGTVLTIFGNGNTEHFSTSKPAPWGTEITKVIVEDGVNSLGRYAFYNCKKLNSAEIADSVTSLGNNIFRNCSSLTAIDLPKALTVIESYSFYGCSGLTEMNIPDSVTDIDFFAFYNCNSLEKLRFGQAVRSIGSSAFQLCSALESITIPNNVTSIGECAFGTCLNLTSVFIPASVTSIGSSPFRRCENLSLIAVDEKNPVYHSKNNCLIETDEKILVQGCNGSVIPSDGSVAVIGHFAFSGCESLVTLNLPDTVTTIGNSAFHSCSNLISVTIPHSVTSIENYAFGGCTALTSFFIPNSVTSLGKYFPIRKCDSLVTLEVEEGNPVYHSNGNCVIETASKTLIGTCQSSVIPSDGSVTSIGVEAFIYSSSLTSVTIPDAVTSIQSFAFAYCDNLTSIVLPTSITNIEKRAFYDNVSLKDVWYTGSESDRANISIQEEGNTPLSEAHWHYNTCKPDEHEYRNDFDTTCEKCEWVRKDVADYIPGDLNGEDGVTSADAIYLLYHAIFGNAFYPVNQPSDFNQDGAVSSADAVYLLYHTLFGDTNYPL